MNWIFYDFLIKSTCECSRTNRECNPAVSKFLDYATADEKKTAYRYTEIGFFLCLHI